MIWSEIVGKSRVRLLCLFFSFKKKEKFYDYSPSADLLLLLYNWAELERRSFISTPSGPSFFFPDPPPPSGSEETKMLKPEIHQMLQSDGQPNDKFRSNQIR
jgi:hypothetical protein